MTLTLLFSLERSPSQSQNAFCCWISPPICLVFLSLRHFLFIIFAFFPTHFFCLAVIKLNRHKYQTAAMKHGCSLLSRVFTNTQRLAESLVTKQAVCVNYTRSDLQRKSSRDTYSRLLWEKQTHTDTNTDDMFIETNSYNKHAGKFIPTERCLRNKEIHINNNVNISQTANVSEKFWWRRSNCTSLKSLNWICHNLCKPKKDRWLSKIRHSTLHQLSKVKENTNNLSNIPLITTPINTDYHTAKT